MLAVGTPQGRCVRYLRYAVSRLVCMGGRGGDLQRVSSVSAMNPDTIIHLGSEALKMVLLISAPMLLVGLVVGVLISLFQAVTQIQEMTLTFVPKIIVVFVAMIVAGPWMLATMMDFTRHLFEMIPTLLQ